MWDGLNKRKFPRARYRCKINIRRQPLPPKTITAYTENLGLGGICVIIKEDLQLFRNVEVELFLKNGNPPVACKGGIVWIVKKTGVGGHVNYDTGIEFNNLKKEDESRIALLVDEVLKKEEPEGKDT